MSKKPNIHFILPAGGVRGAFQAGFLYQLFKKYKDHFLIARIDGTSVGALNGFAVINNKIDTLKNIWFNIESINDLFSSWSNSYIFSDYLSYYHGFYKGGLFSNEKLLNLIKDTSENTWNSFPDDYKDKYSCVAVNIGTAKSKYITGSNKHILDYITASASPWVISNPVKIEEQLYADGGLLETYPVDFIDKCDADITLILGYDQEHFSFISRENDNILTYLANLIDISRFNSVNTHKLKEIIKQDSVVALANPMTLLFTDFSKEAITDGFESGIDFANTFFNTYIKDYSDTNFKNMMTSDQNPFEEHYKSK
jgi:predicted acylesterase/phospholipase RssA